MKKYQTLEISVLAILQADVITESAGVEGLAEIEDAVLFKDTF